MREKSIKYLHISVNEKRAIWSFVKICVLNLQDSDPITETFPQPCHWHYCWWSFNLCVRDYFSFTCLLGCEEGLSTAKVGLGAIFAGFILVVLNNPGAENEMTAQLSYTTTTRQLHPWAMDRHGDITEVCSDTPRKPCRNIRAGCRHLGNAVLCRLSVCASSALRISALLHSMT